MGTIKGGYWRDIFTTYGFVNGIVCLATFWMILPISLSLYANFSGIFLPISLALLFNTGGIFLVVFSSGFQSLFRIFSSIFPSVFSFFVNIGFPPCLVTFLAVRLKSITVSFTLAKLRYRTNLSTFCTLFLHVFACNTKLPGSFAHMCNQMSKPGSSINELSLSDYHLVAIEVIPQREITCLV